MANPTQGLNEYLSGDSVIDMATDNMVNFGATVGQTTLFNLAYLRTPYYHSGKHTLKNIGGNPAFACIPRLLFVALSDVGKIDVIEIDTGTKFATIDVPGVRVVADYWRQ